MDTTEEKISELEQKAESIQTEVQIKGVKISLSDIWSIL